VQKVFLQEHFTHKATACSFKTAEMFSQEHSREMVQGGARRRPRSTEGIVPWLSTTSPRQMQLSTASLMHHTLPIIIVKEAPVEAAVKHLWEAPVKERPFRAALSVCRSGLQPLWSFLFCHRDRFLPECSLTFLREF
jgi:hypothetical protein